MNNEFQDLQKLTERVNHLERILSSFLVHESDAPVTLAANRFVLRDSNGIERALLSAPDKTCTALLLYDSNGTTRLFAGVEDKGPTISLYDVAETPRLKLAVDDPTNGTAISLHNSKGTTQVSIASIEGEPVRLALHDSNGIHRADLFYAEDEDDHKGGALALKDSNGKVRVMVSDTCIAVLDANGKIVFYAPDTSDDTEAVSIPSHLLLHKNGQQHGPYPIEQVKAWIAAGQVQGTDQVWYEGASGWMTVASIPGLLGE